MSSEKRARGLYTPAPVLLLRTYLVSNVVADHLVLLDHLRSILVAVGEADQVPEESHALFLERFDELRALLPIDPIESQYLGQDILCQVIPLPANRPPGPARPAVVLRRRLPALHARRRNRPVPGPGRTSL
jgi:hypothetical protein